MLKIAFCDDCQYDRNILMSHLSHIEEEWKDTFDIYPFKSGISLCENLKENSYDIILLDILMDDLDGIETARKIRSMGEDSKIIFISSYDEKLRELFRVGTIAFLDKPLRCSDLEDALKDAYNTIQKEIEKVFIYTKNGNTHFVPIKDIVYFEANRNQVKIQTTKTLICYSDLFKNVWCKMSENENFIMPNKSFIFNLKYVILKSNRVILKDNSLEFNIGRKYKEDTYDRYFNYIEWRSE